MLLVLYVPKQKMSKMLATHLLSHIQKRCFLICFWITMYHKYHVRLTCYWVERKVKERSSVDYSCSGNLWNSSNSKGWLNGRVICVPVCVCVCIHSPCLHFCLTKNANYTYRCVCVKMCMFGWVGRDHRPHIGYTHTNSATQPSVLHPCPWPSPCTWLILLYSTLCIKVHFKKVSNGVAQGGIEQPPPLLLRSFCGLKASFLLVSSH